MTTGDRIKQLRIEKHMSQEELGEKVGVQKAAINKYETGLVVNLKRSTIAKLAAALDVTPAYLMGWEDPDPAPYYDDEVSRFAEELRSNAGMRMLFDAAKDVKSEDLQKVADLISMFKERSNG